MDPLRVLCVDDDPDAADTTAHFLQLAGYDARACYDGATALSVVGEFRPDVCVLDLGMPGISGFDLAAWLRTQAGGRRLGLIAVTGWSGEAVERRAKDAGFHVVLAKPADPQRLAAAVSDVHGQFDTVEEPAR